jgi:leader peptidase (prepilin peptidase) / N-methyltransferase
MMSPPWICAFAAAGLVLGPRQRACIFRHTSESTLPGPRRGRCPVCPVCPVCAAALLPGRWRFWPALPVTGRCAECGARIGPPPLTVEIAAAAVLGLLAARIGPGFVLAAAAWLAVCAVPLAGIDVATHRLPDPLTGIAYLGTVTLLAAAALTAGRPGELVRAVAGGAALAACYLALFLISPSGMGLGDTKMSASLGTALAWFGWNTLLTGAFAGFLLGGIYAAGLLIARRVARGHHIAFGPFMIVGAFLAVMAGAAVG